jgi:hypothetical protein
MDLSAMRGDSQLPLLKCASPLRACGFAWLRRGAIGQIHPAKKFCRSSRWKRAAHHLTRRNARISAD